MIATLNEIGSRLDLSHAEYHLADGIKLRIRKSEAKKGHYQYCPSTEGLLPSWLKQTDNIVRWLTVCSEIYNHPDSHSHSRFPVHLIHSEFPEFVDIDIEDYFHGFWATYEAIKAYGFDHGKPWERNTPTILHFLGAMQAYIPYHAAIDPQKFQDGDKFDWKVGDQYHTYAKDIFDINPDEPMPKAPALRLKDDLDGTSAPSYDGIDANLIPSVNTF